MFLLEPGTGEIRPLLPETPGEPGASGEPDERVEPGEPGGEAPAAAAGPRPGEVRELEFEPGDGALRIHGEAAVVRLPIGGAGPVPRDRWEWISEPLGELPDSVSWSDDLAVALAAEEPFAASEPGLDPAQVYRLDEARAVVLEGFAELEEPESVALSPDGSLVFAAAPDRAASPAKTLVPDYLGERVTTREGRRRLADDGPDPTALWVWDTRTGERRAVLLGAPAGADPAAAPGLEEPAWVRSLGWAPQPHADSPARLALVRTAADFRRRELWIWESGGARLLHVERDERWVGGPGGRARWSAGGRWLLLASECTPASSTPGRAQLFSVAAATGELRQLTAVGGEVSRFTPLDDGGVVFQYHDGEPARRLLGLVPAEALEEGTEPGFTSLATPATGWSSSPVASAAGERLVYVHEELGVPGELWWSQAGRRATRRLTDTVPEEFRAVDWILPEKLEISDSDGAAVRAHVYLPPGSALERPDAPRAAIVFVHGAGYLQNVTDSMTRYPLNLLFHSRLAALGYVIVDVDYRGSAGYGNRFRTGVQYHLGGRDLEDIHDVLDELTARGVVDPDRIAVYGGSYGGFLTLMALFTAPERWVAGAALRSVTDWRSYHPGYTQPRLGRPSTHPEAYRRSSPIDHVDGLEDPLLLLHGLVDSNVFAQDTIRLMEELIDRSLDFEAMLYPSQGHAFEDGPHWLDEYRRIERFLLRHLGPPLPEGAARP